MCGIHVAVSATRIPEIADGLKKSLCCRGPDFLGYTTRTVLRSGLPDISIHCTSTVLALRGDHITKQPLEDADSGSLLCWNGEAWKFDDQPVEGNDGEGLFARLGAIKEVRLDARRDSVLDVLRLVKGPFALVYFDAVGKCLYYARDRLGRRSLLVHTEGQGETLVLASVAGAAEPDWKEVPADGIYAIDLDETPEVSGPALSASRHSWTPSEEADLICGIGRFNMDLPHADDTLDSSSSSVAVLHAQLTESLKLRALNVPRPPGLHTDDIRVAILFSGGLDCTVLARLANEVVPADQGIDLINMAFDSRRGQTPTNNEVVAHDVYEQCPDRGTGRRAFAELKRACPARNWRFIAANITKEEALAHKGRVVSLMFPHNTEMDLSIALALYFASRGIGYGYTAQAEFDSTAPNVTSLARVLLSGLGADELFGGYSRHATAFKRKGYPGLVDELKSDVSRITERNLGRDDRIISSWGKEVRFPYLDEDLFRSAIATPVAKKCDFGNTSHPSGIEPAKRVLRFLADGLGLPSTAREKKRAIQFGSRTAKLVRTGGKVSGTDRINGPGAD